jgi:hypothetical protein
MMESWLTERQSKSTSAADFANSKDNRGPEILVVTGAFLGLTWFSVLLRFYVRLQITNSFQLDDWLMLSGIVSYLCHFSQPRRTEANDDLLGYFHCQCGISHRRCILGTGKTQCGSPRIRKDTGVEGTSPSSNWRAYLSSPSPSANC